MADVPAVSPDLIAVVTNVGVFLVAAFTTIFGIWSAVKKIKNALPSDADHKKQLVGGMIMDHTTLLMWSESNRDVCDALDRHAKEMMELRFAMTQLRDKL